MSFLLKLKEKIKKNDTLKFYAKYFRMLQLKRNYNKLSDEKFLKQQYKFNLGKELDIANPQLYNEKLQWYKLYYQKPELHKLVDKYEVREFVKEKIGEEYLIPLYGVYDSIDEVNFDELPNDFVVKLTNGSGCNYICKGKTDKKIKEIKKKFRKWIKVDYYYYGREYAYRGLKNRIVIEKYIKDSNGQQNDYKAYCFDGKIKAFQFDENRYENHKRYYYNENWELIYCKNHPEVDKNSIKKPINLDLQKELSEELANGFPQVRIDFYNLDGKLYFGELTFYHGDGFLDFCNNDFDKYLGECFNLPEEKIIDENW